MFCDFVNNVINNNSNYSNNNKYAEPLNVCLLLDVSVPVCIRSVKVIFTFKMSLVPFSKIVAFIQGHS